MPPMNFRVISACVLAFSMFAAVGQPAAKPTVKREAGRHDVASSVDLSRALLFPVSYDEAVRQNVPVITRKEIYKDGWIDLNKNGSKDVYEDASQPVGKRVDDLLRQMTVEEKTMQLVTLYGYNRITPDFLPTKAWLTELQKDGIANIDEHLNGFNYYENDDLPGNRFVKDPRKLVWALNETRRFFIEDTRLGIPCEFTNEGLRGTETAVSTGFPVPLAQASTWNRKLIRDIASIAGRETKALGYDSLYAPLVDVLRDPRWGRCEEMYGESPWLVGEYATMAVQAIQEAGVVSSPKHYCIYSSAMGARQGYSRTDPQIPPREVEMIHMWPWRRVMRDAKPLGVMASYNDYDGEPIAASKHYLIDVLRGEMGFDGYVVSDSDAVEYLHTKHHVAASQKDAVRQTILAGMNVRTNFSVPETFITPLRELIAEGAVPMEVIDSRVRDVLSVKFRTRLFDEPYRPIAEAARIAMAKEHMDISLQASREAVILFKNEKNFLPLDASRIKTIALSGPNADSVEYARQHYGPLMNETVTVKRALETYGGGKFTVLHSRGCEFTDDRWPATEILPQQPLEHEQAQIDEAVSNAEKADLAVVVVGDSPYGSKSTRTTCGENNSRTGLSLAGYQDDLVRALAATGKPLVVIHFSGRPNALNWPDKVAPAILHSFLPGPFGGQAAVEAMFGDINPAGKTPATFVKTTGQLPLAFPAKPGANTESNRAVNGYLRPFGFGLSYTTFEYKNVRVSAAEIPANGKFNVEFEITNTGRREGVEIPQVYIHDETSSLTVFERQLRGFDRIALKPSETKTVTIPIDAAEHMFAIGNDLKPFVEAGAYEILVGASSTDIRGKAVVTVKAP